MYTFYKQYMIRFKEENGKIIVTSIIANGNFQCLYGEKTYNSMAEVERDIDSGVYGCRT